MPEIKLHKRLPNLTLEEEMVLSNMILEAYTMGRRDGKPKWIPVTERLPEKGAGKVLVVKQYRGKPYIDIGEVIEGRFFCYLVSALSDVYRINRTEHKFTHWMPLPRMPKGE